jgi:hypothetical protein
MLDEVDATPNQLGERGLVAFSRKPAQELFVGGHGVHCSSPTAGANRTKGNLIPKRECHKAQPNPFGVLETEGLDEGTAALETSSSLFVGVAHL